MNKKLSTENYKGVRDFYPEDMAIQRYIFTIWKNTLESFGYENYDASILEPTDLYKAKSGEEIVNEQTYNFIDRGDREVTLRPEMTPTVARMVAQRRRELSFPLRWFSIPNLFRYERPQRGRLREHWQLNVDFFGISDIEADIEVIEIATAILKNFGLNDSQFEVRINDRRLMNSFFKDLNLNEIEAHQLSKLIDKKNKINDFDEQAKKIAGDNFSFDLKPNETIETVIDRLRKRGISNVVFDPTIMRGFDYYTGLVFEVYDTGSDNNRALFGGGRYDDLVKIFDQDPIPAFGFGQGDVTMRDVLETYNLLPDYISRTHLTICTLNEAFFEPASVLASELRNEGLNVSVDYSGKKVGDQISKAHKKKIPFVICVGDDEISSSKFTIKQLENGKSKTVKRKDIVSFIKKNLK